MDLKEYERAMRREARRILEKKLRRKLCQGEACHHIDGNFTNNDPNNLMAVDAREHLSYHIHGGQVRPYKKNLMLPDERPCNHVEFISTTNFITPEEARKQRRMQNRTPKV